MERQTAFNIWYVMLAPLAAIWPRDAWVGVSRVEAIQYGEFLHHAETGELEEIAIANNVIQAKLRKPTPDGRARFGADPANPVNETALVAAHHEMGHAPVAMALPGAATEQLVFGRTSAGAADELARVSDMARSMVTRYGMHDFLPNFSPAQEPSPPLPVPGFTAARGYGDHTPQAIDDAVTEIVAAAFQRALALLARNREILERAAALLLERETLVEAELRGLAAQLAPAISGHGGGHGGHP